MYIKVTMEVLYRLKIKKENVKVTQNFKKFTLKSKIIFLEHL